MIRSKIVAGNWKLNLNLEESRDLARALGSTLDRSDRVSVVVFPTALHAVSVREALSESGIEVGVQDVFSEASGAFTGATSPAHARAAGLTRALVGHSERRTIFGESDHDTRSKLRACLENGILPMLCVGESLLEREAGETFEVILRQVDTALSGVPEDQLGSVTIAYEPVWAIGTGQVASPTQANEVHQFIRAHLAAHYPRWLAPQMRILYGGSVNAKNCTDLLSMPDIDGALVGGASLKAADFAAIVKAAKNLTH